ncbi:MAG: 30S ribosomal protein S4 [Firmicutes bacterium]|nr:30S ribosomal protein S4 [Bacillota bacterium]
MARYTGPVCRLCRRQGEKLYLKGDRCYTTKCAVDRRTYAPGQHGQNRRSKVSEYGIQLREKQKLRRIYGLLEAQTESYFEEAARKKGVTGENLLQILETRLDNVVFRLGFATSRAEARQLVRHGHFTVNGKKVNIPSYLLRVGDVVSIKETSRKSPRIEAVLASTGQKSISAWLSMNREGTEGTLVALPTREQIDVPIQEHLIVEYYSR